MAAAWDCCSTGCSLGTAQSPSVKALISDFQGSHTNYKAAHAFFISHEFPTSVQHYAPAVPILALYVGAGAVLGVLSPVPVTPTHCLCLAACPEPLVKELRKSRITKAIRTLKEINLAFLPYESQLLGALPPSNIAICYRKDCDDDNFYLAHVVLAKLEAFKVYEPSMGDGPHKAHSQLLIVDWSFDLVSPLLHELTYQAMACDLLSIENNTYKYETTGTSDLREKEALLDEDSELWVQLRHMHIADISKKVTELLHAFSESKKLSTDKANIEDLSQMVKKMPQYQKELSKVTGLELLVGGGQGIQWGDGGDLGHGDDGKRGEINDPVKIIVPVLLNPSGGKWRHTLDGPGPVPLQEAGWRQHTRGASPLLRSRQDVSMETLRKLIQDASIQQQGNIIRSMGLLGTSLTPGSKQLQPERKVRLESTYPLSRWTPRLKDIMEVVLRSKKFSRDQLGLVDRQSLVYTSIESSCLDIQSEYNSCQPTACFGASASPPPGISLSEPLVSTLPLSPPVPASGSAYPSAWHSLSEPLVSTLPLSPPSACFGHWHKSKPAAEYWTGPRLIIYVLGGVSVSEMRCAYEVTQASEGKWEVVIGSSHILTPKHFLDDVQTLNQLAPEET
nr:syntaxin-binding protein 2-like [Chelonoidis abingdonii]